MDSQILRLLIISLLITVSFCLFPPLVNYTGNLPSYPNAQVLSPFYFTGYPGPAVIEIQAVSSVIVCITPDGPIMNNLATGCPQPIHFDYISPAPINEFLLFLDDFSMNFIGQEAENHIKRKPSHALDPYTPQTSTFSLLQNIPYYITIGLAEDVGNNQTLTFVEDFVLTHLFQSCGEGYAPNLNYDGTGNPCTPIAAQLTPNTSSSHPLSVNSTVSTLISFDVTEFSYAAQLDFHIFDKEYDMTIYFAFNFLPSETNYQFKYSNSSQDEVILAENDFLGSDLFHSFSYVIQNPKTGIYYALITSNATADTHFNVEFNTSLCNPAANDCGGNNITTYTSSDIEVLNITFTDTVQYIAVLGEEAIFGIDVNNTGAALIQMDYNSLPSGIANTSIYQYNINTSLVLSFQTTVPQNTFVFGLINSNGVSQDTFTALVWTGSQCPSNCSSNGNCDATTTLCTCNSGYNGRYCQTKNSSHKKLSTLYIILIIIGSAIVLAILIGVPVALFLNNRKKARYERV